MCGTSSQKHCADRIKSDSHSCLPPCSGLHVTGFTKSGDTKISHINHDLDKHIPNEIEDYKAYTKWNEMPSPLKGNSIYTFYMRHEMHYDNEIDLIPFQIMNGKIN